MLVFWPCSDIRFFLVASHHSVNNNEKKNYFLFYSLILTNITRSKNTILPQSLFETGFFTL